MNRRRILAVSYLLMCFLALLFGMHADQTANSALDKGDAAAALLGGTFPMLVLTSPLSWLLYPLFMLFAGDSMGLSFFRFASMAVLGYIQWFILIPKIFHFFGSLVRRRAS